MMKMELLTFAIVLIIEMLCRLSLFYIIIDTDTGPKRHK